MEIREYQEFTRETRVGPWTVERVIMGLTEEVGEIAAVYKRVHRGDISKAEAAGQVFHELGDVFWYLATLADVLGVDLQSVAEDNRDKLLDRQERGVIKGEGDER